MIKSAALLLICFLSCLITNGQKAEIEVISTDTLRFPGELKSRVIPLAVGTFFEIPANCLKNPTSFVRANKFIFPDASLGKIDSCSMTYELETDTVRQMIITLPNEKGLKQAGKQAAKQFGKPVYSKDGSKYVYAWKYTTSDKRKLNIRLEVAADQKHGMLYIDEQV